MRRTIFCLLILPIVGIGQQSEPGRLVRLLQENSVFAQPKLLLQTSVLIKGGTSGKGHGFREVFGLYLDHDNSLYILERNRISKWTHSGEYLKDIGSQGQGPGEFSQPIGMHIHKDGRIFLNDQGRSLIIYSKTGDYLSRIRLSFWLSPQFFVDDQDAIYGLANTLSSDGQLRQFVKMDSKGNILKVFDGFRWIDFLTQASQGGQGGVWGGMQHEYSPTAYICRTSEAIYYAYNLDNIIRKYDLSGKCLVEFAKQEKSRSTKAALAAAENAWGRDYVQRYVKFPQFIPFFQGLQSDEKGRVYVVKTRVFLSKDKSQTLDVFDKCGYYLYQIVLPDRPAIIRNGVLYGITQDEEGWPVITKTIILNAEELPAVAPDCGSVSRTLPTQQGRRASSIG